MKIAFHSLFISLVFVSFVFAQETQPTSQPTSQPAKPTLEEVKKFLQDHHHDNITFDGMFAGIEKLGPATLDHLNTLISDPELSLKLRSQVPRAMTELGDKRAIEMLKGYLEDIFMEDEIKNEVPFALYHLGETEQLDKALKQTIGQISQIAKQPPPEATQQQIAQAMFQLHMQLMNLSYRTRKYDISCKAYESLNKMFPDQTNWYNWACSLSLNGQLDEAVEKLKMAVEKGWSSADDMENDGDLRNLKEHQGFKDLLKQMREGGAKKEEEVKEKIEEEIIKEEEKK